MTFELTCTYALHASTLMAPARQNVGLKFPSAVVVNLYEQRAAIGSTLAGASTWRATGVPIGRGVGLGMVKGLGEGSGLCAGSGLSEGSGLGESSGPGARLATGNGFGACALGVEDEQQVKRTRAATAPAHLMLV
jgi:hypothetical protein